MSYEDARITSTRREAVSLKKLDPFLSIGAAMALGVAGWFFYRGFLVGGAGFGIFLAAGIVLVVVAGFCLAFGGWRPFTL